MYVERGITPWSRKSLLNMWRVRARYPLAWGITYPTVSKRIITQKNELTQPQRVHTLDSNNSMRPSKSHNHLQYKRKSNKASGTDKTKRDGATSPRGNSIASTRTHTRMKWLLCNVVLQCNLLLYSGSIWVHYRLCSNATIIHSNTTSFVRLTPTFRIQNIACTGFEPYSAEWSFVVQK